MHNGRTKQQIVRHGKVVGLATKAIEAGIQRGVKAGYSKDHDIALAILVELEEVFQLRIKRGKSE